MAAVEMQSLTQQTALPVCWASGVAATTVSVESQETHTRSWSLQRRVMQGGLEAGARLHRGGQGRPPVRRQIGLWRGRSQGQCLQTARLQAEGAGLPGPSEFKQEQGPSVAQAGRGEGGGLVARAWGKRVLWKVEAAEFRGERKLWLRLFDLAGQVALGWEQDSCDLGWAGLG